jgi:hypothetical protein
MKITEVAQSMAYFFTRWKLDIDFGKKIGLGDFLTNASGHPDKKRTACVLFREFLGAIFCFCFARRNKCFRD